MAACVKIQRKQHLSLEDFNKLHLEPARPVIIENFTTDWPCMKWTLTSVKEKAGDNTVNVRRNTMSNNYVTGKKYNIEKMRFSEYIDNLLQNNKKSKDSYLAVQNVKKALPQLENEIPLPAYIGKLHGGPFLWIAPEGHYEFCHFDPDDGFLVMISGRKRIRLYGCDINTMYPNPLGSKGKTIQSQVNCDEPDLEKFSNFAKAFCYEEVIQSGEMLFIPAFWWHQITSLTQSISVNMFYGDRGNNRFLSKILREPVIDSFSYWFLNIIEQNRHLDCFSRILLDFKRVFTSFCEKTWKEFPSDEQVNKVVDIVLEYLGMDRLPPQEVQSSSKHPPMLKIRGLLWRS